MEGVLITSAVFAAVALLALLFCFVPVGLWVTAPFKAAWCCQRVCSFRYAGDMRQP